MKGIFITLEGIEGSGKSTQGRFLAEWLSENGKKTLFLREPGSTKIGEEIRRILLSPENGELFGRCELFLFLAARAQLVSEKIEPFINQGGVVVLDRYSDSTYAYQGFAQNMPLDTIIEINKFATLGLEPDITFILDLELEESLAKAGAKDRIERKGLEFHSKVRDGYYKLAAEHSGRIKIIKVKNEPLQTQQDIRSFFKEKFTL